MLSERYLKIEEVVKVTSYSRAQIYRLMKSGEFPSSYRLSKNRVAWKETEIRNWSENRKSTTLMVELDRSQRLLKEVWG
ncbi:AlpA family phage regulatory protein [Vibrio vulnificus]|uniref:helix-turn-helix transcriptional regulator n=1 Tax=Vibrio TaxID=662 RepID=UPI000CE3781B|nr:MULTISPECIES: AlpA family phage regulatory protein [Vibrio]